jgi:hypothetical protein
MATLPAIFRANIVLTVGVKRLFDGHGLEPHNVAKSHFTLRFTVNTSGSLERICRNKQVTAALNHVTYFTDK